MTFISHAAPQNQPRMTETFSRLIRAATAQFRNFISRHKTKARLGNLPEKYLRDIGLTQNDVASIPHMPLPSNGVLFFSEIGRSRAGNW